MSNVPVTELNDGRRIPQLGCGVFQIEPDGTVADGVGRSPAQVVLRWHIQRGDIVFPKSVSPDRMTSNSALFDFELDNSDMDAISALDQGESGRTGPNPDKFDYIPK
jgi:2,5-diketo-D-gluconate reductase A